MKGVDPARTEVVPRGLRALPPPRPDERERCGRARPSGPVVLQVSSGQPYKNGAAVLRGGALGDGVTLCWRPGAPARSTRHSRARSGSRISWSRPGCTPTGAWRSCTVSPTCSSSRRTPKGSAGLRSRRWRAACPWSRPTCRCCARSRAAPRCTPVGRHRGARGGDGRGARRPRGAAHCARAGSTRGGILLGAHGAGLRAGVRVGGGRGVRLLVVGASASPTCGVRDYAAALGP